MNNQGYENLKIHKGKSTVEIENNQTNNRRRKSVRQSVKRSQLTKFSINSDKFIAQNISKSFSLSADVINMFAEVGCKPPLQDIDIEACLKEVSEKKDFYVRMSELKKNEDTDLKKLENSPEKVTKHTHRKNNLSLDDYTMFPEFR